MLEAFMNCSSGTQQASTYQPTSGLGRTSQLSSTSSIPARSTAWEARFCLLPRGLRLSTFLPQACKTCHSQLQHRQHHHHHHRLFRPRSPPRHHPLQPQSRLHEQDGSSTFRNQRNTSIASGWMVMTILRHRRRHWLWAAGCAIPQLLQRW